jgi:hypothetical protein
MAIKEEKTGFKVVESNTILRTDRNPGDADRKLTTMGSVARLASGRLVARSVSHDTSGSVLLHYGEYDPEITNTDLAPPAWRPDTYFAATLGRVSGDRGWHVLGPSDDDAQLADFARREPAVARHIGLTLAGEIAGLFSGGVVRVEKAIGLSHDDFRSILAKHRSGDFGTWGSHNATPLSDEDLFMVGTLPVARFNSASIRAQSGSVRSTYDNILSHAAVSVLTILAGPATRTLMFIGEF